jgi:hypothetical protein
MLQHPHNVSIREDRAKHLQDHMARERSAGWKTLGLGAVLLVVTLFVIPTQDPGTIGRWIHMGFNVIVVLILLGGFYQLWDNRSV